MFGGGQIALNELLKRADVAMYQAKAAGRNGACFYDPAIQAAATERAQLVVEMRRGLECGEFMLYYQPQVDRTGRVIGAEALVRWNHPANGTMLPEEFISLAEETSMILPLGQWVLETACAQLVVLARHPETADWSIAINVSALHFAQANFVAQVDKALKSTGANPTRLKLELTESMLAVNMDDIIAKMKAINSWGGVFSLDDFGTGYSSLTYLRRLPVSTLKVDKSFIDGIIDDVTQAEYVRFIINLAHALKLLVVAEGVEFPAQVDKLRQYDCDCIQGFVFSRPLPPEVAVRLLDK